MSGEDKSSGEGINQGIDVLATPSRMAIESELSEALKKLEYRAEVLTSISREQEASGYYGLAEAYRKQAAESKAYAQSIRKLLNLRRER